MQVLDAVFELTSDAMMLTDPNAAIVRVNPAFHRITGYPLHDVLGRQPSCLRSGRHGMEFYQNLWKSLSSSGHWHGEIWNRRKNGDIFRTWTHITRLDNAAGEIEGYLGAMSSLPSQDNEEAQYVASHYDALTGLPNRQFLRDRLHLTLSLARRYEGRFAVLHINLDGLASINELLGYLSGDRVLQEVGSRLQKRIREIDIVSRIGRDEFVVVIAEIKLIEDVVRISRTLQTWLQMPCSVVGQAVTISASIGVSLYPDDSDNPDVLLERANQAMRQAKSSGRGRICFYNQSKDGGPNYPA